ncbi:QueT transporter family protein [Clostridium sp. DL1XJH146]
MNKSVRFLVQASLIAAIYAVLTIVLAPISYGPLQVRVSEALTVLPFFMPAAIPGLAVGCLLANIVGGYGLADIIFGTLATLIAAVITSKMKSKALAPIPPIIVNGLIVGTMLHYVANFPLIPTILWVAFGELIACYVLGYPLLKVLENSKLIKND